MRGTTWPSALRMQARKFPTKRLVRSEFQYFALQQKSKKINRIEDVKNIYFA